MCVCGLGHGWVRGTCGCVYVGWVVYVVCVYVGWVVYVCGCGGGRRGHVCVWFGVCVGGQVCVLVWYM